MSKSALSSGYQLAHPSALSLSYGGVWTAQDDQQLIDLVFQVGLDQWDHVATSMSTGTCFTAEECRLRWTKLYFHNKHRGKWDNVEDQLLYRIVMDEITRREIDLGRTPLQSVPRFPWSDVSARHFWRTAKQCRDRWLNCLNPYLNKQEWSKKEVELIYQQHMNEHQPPSVIARSFRYRSETSIRNLCQKLATQSKTQQQTCSSKNESHKNPSTLVPDEFNEPMFLLHIASKYIDDSLYQRYHRCFRWYAQLAMESIRNIPNIIWDCLPLVYPNQIYQFLYTRILRTEGYECTLQIPSMEECRLFQTLAGMVFSAYRYALQWDDASQFFPKSRIHHPHWKSNMCLSPTCILPFFTTRPAQCRFLPTMSDPLFCSHPSYISYNCVS